MAWWFKDLLCELCESFASSAVKFFYRKVRQEHRQSEKTRAFNSTYPARPAAPRDGFTTLSVYWINMPVLKNIAAIAKGMSITFMEMFQPTTVENYPDGKDPLRGARIEARFRGAHVLQRDENGLEKCVACFLCAANCPSNCIYIEAAENTAEKRVSGAERYAKVYNIDYNRCIFCGYCVEACPTDAITHGHGFELATFNASNLIYRKEQMLAPRPAHMGANIVFNQADVDGGAPTEMVHGS
jgi:NADH-quinone oxidoreductase subunit I